MPVNNESKSVKSASKRAKRLLLFPILLVLVIISLVIARMTIWKPVPPKEYKRFYLDALKTKYVVDSDFTIENELPVTQESENRAMRSEKLFDISKAKDLATKLGLGKQTTNEKTRIYLWSTDTFDSNRFIKLDLILGSLEVNYASGISKDVVEPEQVYEYIVNFMGLTGLDATMSDRVSSGNNEYIQFTLKKNEKQVWGPSVTGPLMTVTRTDKIITGFSYFWLEPQYNSEREMKPVVKINSDELTKMNYSIEFYPSRVIGQSTQGSESSVKLPVKTNMLSSKNVYYYYFDPIANTSFLLPAVQVDGRYIDDKNETGTFTMVVINQLYDPNIK
jgi:hypothetical protein